MQSTDFSSSQANMNNQVISYLCKSVQPTFRQAGLWQKNLQLDQKSIFAKHICPR